MNTARLRTTELSTERGAVVRERSELAMGIARPLTGAKS